MGWAAKEKNARTVCFGAKKQAAGRTPCYPPFIPKSLRGRGGSGTVRLFSFYFFGTTQALLGRDWVVDKATTPRPHASRQVQV